MQRLLRRGSHGRDVKELQGLLNNVHIPDLRLLVTDGIFGKKTWERTRAFQKKARIKIDGIVGPQTLAALRKAVFVGPIPPKDFTPTPYEAPKAPPRAKPKNPDDERALSHHEAKTLVDPGTHASWRIDTFTGMAKAGRCYMSFSGRRMVIAVNSASVVYLICEKANRVTRGLLFIQTKAGFISDVRYWAFSDAAKKARGMKTVAEWEACIAYGIATSLYGPAFAACVGVSTLVFLEKNHHKFKGWKLAIDELIEARSILKMHTPTLYDELFDYVLENTLSNMASEIGRDPNIAGRILGSLIGKVIKIRNLDKRGEIIAEVAKLLAGAAWRVKDAIPGAAKEAGVETANELALMLQQGQQPVPRAIVDRVVDEVYAHPKEVQQSLEHIHKAFMHIQ